MTLRNSLLAGLALTFCTACAQKPAPAPEQTAEAKVAPAAPQMTQEEMMAKFEKAATPAQNHKLLDQLVEVFMPEATSLRLGRIYPHRNDKLLHGSEGFICGDAGIGHSTHAVFENLRVVRFGEVTLLGEVLVPFGSD